MMKMRAIAAAIVAAAALVSLAGCGSNTGSSSNPSDNTIVFWHNSTTGEGKQYYDNVAKAFEKDHPGVTIQVTAVQNEDYDGKLQTALQDPNSAPDLFFQRGGQKMRDMVNAGQLLDLTTAISSDTKTAIGSAIAAGSINGKIYGVPFTVTPGGLWYSKDLFKKAGIADTPKTWDEFKTAVTKLKNAGIVPIALGAKDAWPAAHWWYWSALRECSSATFNAALQSKKFDDQCWTKAGNDVKELQNMGAFNAGYLTTSAQQGANSSAGLLANHKAAMELMGAWEPGVVKDLTPDQKEMTDLGYFQFPTIAGGQGADGVLMGGADSFSCGAWAPKSCGEFLNYLLNTSNQQAWAKAFLAPPANKNAQTAVSGVALQEAMTAYNNSKSYVMWMDTTFGSNIGNALNSGVVNMLAGKGSPQDITKAATEAAAKG